MVHILKLFLPVQSALNTIQLVCVHGNLRGSEIRFEIMPLLLLQYLTSFPNYNTLNSVSKSGDR